jgi:hypothetical protein
MLICCERKTLLNGWLILADKLALLRAARRGAFKQDSLGAAT